MDLETFRELLDTRSADLAAWPEDDRWRAERLLARSSRARAALDAAVHLDDLLGRSAAGYRAGGSLRARITTIPDRHPKPAAQARPRPRAFAAPWRIGAVATATAMLCGVAFGLLGFMPFDDPADAVPVEPVIDVAQVAFGTVIDEDDLP